jgi:hypothetical protein
VAVATGALAGAAGALTLATNVVEVTTPAGTVSLASRVEDNVGGDASRWLFSYELSGSWDPEPGESNGISSLQLFFGGIVDDVRGQTGPPGWLSNCCFSLPPFGVGFDLPDDAGYGAGPNGSALFSFHVPAGTPFTSESQGSFASSYADSAPSGFVILEDGAGGHGPIVPVPEPGTLALLALGLGAIARRRS